MILKALYDYYNRMEGLAPEGMEYKDIVFIIDIDKEGNFIRVEDTRIEKKAQQFLVVKGQRTSGVKPYLFWDNVGYTLGYTKAYSDLEIEKQGKNSPEALAKFEKEIEKTKRTHQALIKKYAEISEKFQNESLKAVSLFYANGGVERIKQSDYWESITKSPTVNVSYRVGSDTKIVAEDPQLRSYASAEDSNSDVDSSICLITGEKSTPSIISTATPIKGSQATAKLVSFQVSSGYDSYGKEQGLNAPISKKADAAYTTALNHLLNSKNKYVIGNRTMIFWTSSNNDASKEAEDGLLALLGLNREDNDPNRNIENVRKVYSSIFSGTLKTTLDDKFYFLGLAPNSARIAVVYWNELPLREFAGHILKHFEDMEIAGGQVRNPYYGVYKILSNVVLKGKVPDVQPNLPEAVIKSIVEGTPYPFSLYSACIRRIRAEQEVYIGRAAIIKAYLNRLNDNNKKIEIMLDKENTNPGYLCGRLFATLEYIQEKSNGGNSTTIRSRYMNAASSTPSVVFPTLINLSVHHSDKLPKGSQVYFEKLKSEIIGQLDSGEFPALLNIYDQGRFMVGYYQQRQDFYSKDDNESNN